MKRAAAFFLLAFPAASFAAFGSSGRGTTAANFLTLGAGARAAAMGGAQTAATEGPFSLAWNPAGLAVRRSVQLDVMHADWFESANYNVVAAGLPLGESAALGIAFQQYSVGDLTRRDNAGFEDGTFGPEDTSAALSWAARTERGYLLGVSGKMIRSEIVDSAGTYAIDAGAMTPETNGHRFGAAITNLGGRLKYDSREENLPLVIAVGGQQKFRRALLSADLKFPRSNDPFLAVGAESGLDLGGGWQGVGRLGYNTRAGTEAGGVTGLAFGMGLGSGWLAVDYAFAPFGDLGSVHLISLSIRGGERAAPAPRP